ncbi:MAG: ornithine carbamoyltransferase [Chloroflexota bacterium]
MKHFINLADLTSEQIWAILQKARDLKDEWQAGGNSPILKGQALGMVFQKPSLRTRVSFEVGMQHLGGSALYLSPAEIGLGKRETVADVARVLSGYVQGIMARTFDHDHILELAEYASVPVINGLSDYNHPCQAITDLFTIWEHKSQLKGLKLAFVGDGNNVSRSLLFCAAKLGVDFTIATPAGYTLTKEDLGLAQDFAEDSEAKITVTEAPYEAVADADIIYTDVWTSMGQEEETAKRLAVFPPYQVNDDLVAAAKSDVLIMHDLPAHRGEEITDSVADGPHAIIFQQAANRLHAQKGILALLMAR